MEHLLTKSTEASLWDVVFPNGFICNIPQTMDVGSSITVTPEFIPNNTTNKLTTCISNDPNILSVETIDASHTLIAHNTGVAVITIASVVTPTLKHTYIVDVIPATTPEDVVYYGCIPASLGITSFAAITEKMINQYLKVTTARVAQKVDVSATAGDILVVVTANSKTATKDNGFGAKVSFASSAINAEDGKSIQANGDVVLTVNNYPYKLYGEFIITSGTQHIYVN